MPRQGRLAYTVVRLITHDCSRKLLTQNECEPSVVQFSWSKDARKRPASRAVDIWKTFIQLHRPVRLERSSWLSEQHSFSVCPQKPA